MTTQLLEDGRPARLTAGRGRGPGGQLLTSSLPVNRCPITGCSEQIDSSRLMCRQHWYQVPKPLRDRIWSTWHSGEGAHSVEHREAVLMAIALISSRSRQHPEVTPK